MLSNRNNDSDNLKYENRTQNCTKTDNFKFVKRIIIFT